MNMHDDTQMNPPVEPTDEPMAEPMPEEPKEEPAAPAEGEEAPM
jgi:hypothetical protein